MCRVFAVVVVAVVLGLAHAGAVPRGTPTQLIRPGAEWRYQLVVSNAPPAGWTEAPFDDGEWGQRPAGFSAGYNGYFQAATALPSFQGPAPIRGLLMRRRFEVADPAALLGLFLRVQYEDGLVVWLNGHEVLRRGFAPGDPVPWDASPSSHSVTAAELFDLSPGAAYLLPGTNVLALQVFDADGGSDYPTLFAWPELRANFSRGPVIQNVSTNQATVTWQIPTNAETWIEFSKAESTDARTISVSGDGIDRSMVLTGLEPDTRYRYSVGIRLGARESASEPAEFVTFRPVGDVDFLTIGDTGSGLVAQHRVADRLAQESSDLILHLGDIIYLGFTRERVDLSVFSEYEPIQRRVPFFFTLGNHDVYGAVGDYGEVFALPTNSLTGSEYFYSFDHGDVHFVSLHVPWYGTSGLGAVDAQGQRSDPYRWLTNDLASSAKPWKIVFFHQAMRSSGPHSFDDYDGDGRLDNLQLQELVLPIFRTHGVQLVFNGHDHLWERFAPTNGVHFVVSGGGGAAPYYVVQRDPASAHVAARYHWVRTRVRGPELTCEAVDDQGEVFDRLFIRRAGAGEPGLSAAWHTPSPPPETGNGDGNQLAETFDFRGASVTAVGGDDANLGRLWVNHDARAIHVGLSDVMIWPHQTIALFVGTPRSPGVKSLLGVGAVRNHPLARLGLRFEGFEPSLVGLLGDEFADGTTANLARPGAAAALGQGVFRLNPELTPLGHIRVRQFNRSPEGGPEPDERNANYMVISLPRRELAGVLPGEKIHVAAVVLSPKGRSQGVDLALDGAFVGHHFLAGAPGEGVLEPVIVTLEDPGDGDDDQDGLGSDEETALGTDASNPDTDGDGLPDGWERDYRIDPRSALGRDGADGDADQDGYSNLEEFLSGTDPQDPALNFSLQVAPGGTGVLLTWRAIVGRSYELQVSESIPGPFVPSAIDGFPRGAMAPSESAWIPHLAAPAVSRWFRIREVP